MKAIRFFTFFIGCLMLFATPVLEALVQRTVEIKNHNTREARVAYCFVIKAEDASDEYPGFHVRGWESVPPGHSHKIKIGVSTPQLWVRVEFVGGGRLSFGKKEASYSVHPTEKFKLVHAFGSGAVLYSSVAEGALIRKKFDTFSLKDGNLTLRLPGPLEIKEDTRPLPPEEPQSSSARDFDAVYSTDGFVREGKDYALLFATNEYEHWPNLGTPINDARALKAELEAYGFETELVENVQSRVDFLTKIHEYAAKPWGSGDQLLVYIAGHGEFKNVGQRGFIAASNSQLPKNDEPFASYVSYSDLRDELDGMDCQRVLLMLDVCQGGTFDKKIALAPDASSLRTRGQSRGVKPKLDLNDTLKVKTRWYLTSGGKEDVQDGKEHSPFAAALLTLFRDGAGNDGVLTMPEIERQLPATFQNELDKVEEAYREENPFWEGELKQNPTSGAFNEQASDKAFVFIRKE